MALSPLLYASSPLKTTYLTIGVVVYEVVRSGIEVEIRCGGGEEWLKVNDILWGSRSPKSAKRSKDFGAFRLERPRELLVTKILTTS